jgi:ATP-dependent DNA helicase RecG
MASDRSQEFLRSLLSELRKLPRETEWVEFKESFAEPQEVGEYISALANSAALVGKVQAYLVWGIRNDDHAVVGTTFRFQAARVGNEELENWILRLLSPKIRFCFYELPVEEGMVVILEIERAMRHPVQFSGQEYVRVGSYKKKLKDHPEKERALWRIFDEVPFESTASAEHMSAEEVMKLLDYSAYFELLGRPLPERRGELFESLAADGLISSTAAGTWDITNLGAILFARRLEDFGPLRRKAVRVIRYKGNSRVDTVKEQPGSKGYGAGFEGLISYVNGLLPSNEIIRHALRQEATAYPELAVRELVANALIHQDFSISGSGPTIEIFDDRVEITNPGDPLVRTERFVDSPPRSRNERLASLMRRIGVCEERGSGWDKVVFLTELYQLPAPLTEAIEGNTRVVLFAHRSLAKMSKEDRLRALYLHSCLRYVNREHMTNTTVRERFAIEPHNTATASRLIREAVEARVIVPHDPAAAPKLMRYLPFWAAERVGRT